MDAIDTLAYRFANDRLSRRAALVRGGVGIALGALAAAGKPLAGATQGTPVSGEDLGTMVDIGGRSLYVETHGSGGPTVILEAGSLVVQLFTRAEPFGGASAPVVARRQPQALRPKP